MPKHRTLPLGVVLEDRPIDFLDQLYSRLTLRKPTITVGEGTKRARKRIAEQRAGVAVRDARRQLLQGEVDEALMQWWIGGLAARHLRHARTLQFDWVDRSGGHQVAVDRHRVPTFFGSPPAHPGAPGAVLAEHPLDRTEVVGQVVFGQQIDQEGAAHFWSDLVAAEIGIVG